MNPELNAGPAQAVMPISAFPCSISEGQKFYIIKLHEDADSVVVCNLSDQNNSDD